MAKKITGYIKLQLPAGEATPAPPVGPALGQHGVNIMEFVKQFNAKSVGSVEKGTTLPVVITVYADRSFSFILKTPPAAVLIMKKLGLAKGSATPNKEKVGKITKAQLAEIAKVKMPDLNAGSLEAAVPFHRRLRPLHGRRSRRLMFFARVPSPCEPLFSSSLLLESRAVRRSRPPRPSSREIVRMEPIWQNLERSTGLPRPRSKIAPTS